MIGIVLWCDPTVPKAVFWCEDQGDLAYYNPKNAKDSATSALTAGDLVRFDVEMDQDLRLATNPVLISERTGYDLPKRLIATAALQIDLSKPGICSEILPFLSEARQEKPDQLLRKA
ncbi:MAG: hypothetical protein ACJAVM_000223 [Sulfitobacter sp.]|jgi:hypothetical protein